MNKVKGWSWLTDEENAALNALEETDDAESDCIAAPWTGPILESETIVPLTAETINGWQVREITSLDELREYFREGAYLRISNIRGYWLHVPPEG